MRIVGHVDEAEVVAAYLRGELESDRFSARLRELLECDGADPAVLSHPDLGDPAANAYRLALLGEFRGFGRGEGMFQNFPASVGWSRVALTREELEAILYIDWDWWLRISGGTRRPADAAARIRDGGVPGSNAEEHEPVARRLLDGPPLPELIVVTTLERPRLVLVEGHVRLTAFMLFPSYLPDGLEVFLGEAEDFERWGLF